MMSLPSQGGGVRICTVSPDRAAEVGAVLAASHADYPAFRHLFSDPGRRQRVLRVFMTAVARDAAVHARAVGGEDESGLLGVALWMPPGAFPPSIQRKVRMTPALLRVAFAARGSFLAFARVGARLEKFHASEPAWYLQALGVHPRAQRRGVGTRLIGPVLALADDARRPCHLHTSDPANVAYYRRFGFEVSQSAIEVFADGPTYIGMTRPPQAPADR